MIVKSIFCIRCIFGYVALAITLTKNTFLGIAIAIFIAWPHGEVVRKNILYAVYLHSAGIHIIKHCCYNLVVIF